MRVVIRIIIVGTAIIGILAFIPDIMDPILDFMHDAFNSDLIDSVQLAYSIIPAIFKNFIVVGFAAILLGVILTWIFAN